MKKIPTAKLTGIAVLSAISIALIFICHVPIFPAVSFLEYDLADIPLFMAGFMYGPLYGLLATLIACVIQGVTVSAQSSWYGILMHFLATGSYVLISANIYKRHKTLKGAIVSMLLGSLGWIAIMIVANLTITPAFLTSLNPNVTFNDNFNYVVKVLGFIVRFNLIKVVANSGITLVLYKKVHYVFRKVDERLTKHKEEEITMNDEEIKTK